MPLFLPLFHCRAKEVRTLWQEVLLMLELLVKWGIAFDFNRDHWTPANDNSFPIEIPTSAFCMLFKAFKVETQFSPQDRIIVCLDLPNYLVYWNFCHGVWQHYTIFEKRLYQSMIKIYNQQDTEDILCPVTIAMSFTHSSFNAKFRKSIKDQAWFAWLSIQIRFL